MTVVTSDGLGLLHRWDTVFSVDLLRKKKKKNRNTANGSMKEIDGEGEKGKIRAKRERRKEVDGRRGKKMREEKDRNKQN